MWYLVHNKWPKIDTIITVTSISSFLPPLFHSSLLPPLSFSLSPLCSEDTGENKTSFNHEVKSIIDP